LPGLNVDASPRQLRLGSAIRGVFICVLIAGYAWLFNQPGNGFAASLLVAGVLQVMVLLLRKFVPTYLMPQALHVFELLADGASVLLFALGIFGLVQGAGEL
jgi:hypothetical protein